VSEPAADTGGSFGGRGAAWLVALALGSLAAAGFLGAFGDALYDPPSFASDSFSRSAVGHRAFVELLRVLGMQVVVSRHRTVEKGGAGAVVALLEPRVGPDESASQATFAAINAMSRSLLVVLPKRDALPDPLRPQFVARAELLPLDVPQRVLDQLELGGKVVRPAGAVAPWRGELPLPSLERPQLVVSERLRPLVASDDGILVGELIGSDDDDEEDDDEEPPVSSEARLEASGAVERPPGGWHTIVVADPDLLATHGLGRAENALLLVRALERLGAGAHPLVLDETLHGFEQQPSLVRELLRFPLLPATLSALLVAVLLAWGALVRFGRPRAPEPLLKPGRLALVESTAGLLRHGGHSAHAAAAYLRASKERVAARHRRSGGEGDEAGWLARMAEARGRGGALRAIEDRVRRLAGRRVGGEEEAVRTAQAIHRWREEMTDGAHGDT